MEFMEAVKPPDAHVPANCPFCPVKRDKDPKPKAKIGEDNNPKTLGTNLTSLLRRRGVPYPDRDFIKDEEDLVMYGEYSAQAHHLICGNEVMKEEGEVEKFLLLQGGRPTSKGAAGVLEGSEVPYDINGALNGVWLPSMRDEFRKTEKDKPSESGLMWGKDLSPWEKLQDACNVMVGVERQFHAGSHGNVGKPHNNYVKEAIKRLQLVTVFLRAYSEICPMEVGDQVRKKPPYYPPNGIIRILNLLSRNLRRELVGPPENWNFFISNLALECSEEQKGLPGRR